MNLSVVRNPIIGAEATAQNRLVSIVKGDTMSAWSEVVAGRKSYGKRRIVYWLSTRFNERRLL